MIETQTNKSRIGNCVQAWIKIIKFDCMIKANELRIGNNLLFKGKVIEVSGTHDDQIFFDGEIFDEGYTKRHESEFNAIPLTPETLEKCGCSEWKEEKDKWSTPKGFVFYFFHDRSAYIKISNISLSLDYLHQLQNVLALTGEELIFNRWEIADTSTTSFTQ